MNDLVRTLFIWEAVSPSDVFVPQPDLPIEGMVAGLAWGRCSVARDATAWKVPMTVEPVAVWRTLMEPTTSLSTTHTVFALRRFRRPADVAFIHDGLDGERVGLAWPAIAKAASMTPATR